MAADGAQITWDKSAPVREAAMGVKNSALVYTVTARSDVQNLQAQDSEYWSVLLYAADDADATALAFVKRAIQRQDDLVEAVRREREIGTVGSMDGGSRLPSPMRTQPYVIVVLTPACPRHGLFRGTARSS